MTWHRDSGSSVAPTPLTPRLAVARAGRALSLGALIAGPGALVLVIVAGQVGEELFGIEAHEELLPRAALLACTLLTMLGAIAHPLQIAAARELLLRSSVDAAALRRPAPPAAERRALTIGPQPPLWRLGIWIAMVAAGLSNIGILFASDDHFALAARIAAVAAPLVVSAIGVALLVHNLRSGQARKRWLRRVSRASLRWQVAVTPVERAARPRTRALVVVLGPAVLGGVIFLAGSWLRQPGRFAEPRSWGPAGEAAIEVLILVGALVLCAAAIVAVIVGGAWLRIRTRQDASVIQALDVGADPPPIGVDAVVLDESPLEQGALTLAVAGWTLLVLGSVPAGVALLAGWEGAAPFAWLALLLAPSLGCLALALLLGVVGARRVHARRSRVLAAVRRDPVPWANRFSAYDRPDELWPLARGFSGHLG